MRGVRTEGTAELTCLRHWLEASLTGSQGLSSPENTVSSSLRLESVSRLVVTVPRREVRLPSWYRAATYDKKHRYNQSSLVYVSMSLT